jgi:hypothetical protein
MRVAGLSILFLLIFEDIFLKVQSESVECQNDIASYVQGLQTGELWALTSKYHIDYHYFFINFSAAQVIL